jgi:pyridoxal phosphate enzyme (YggS family)
LVDIGENKAQELNEKYGDVKGGRWHFIGRLQTNKAKAVVGKAWLIHSVDSMKLAKEIDKRARNLGLRQDLLLQVNKGEEESKGGFRLGEAAAAARDMARFENVRVRGLMAVVPIESDEKILRKHFREVRGAFENIRQEQGAEFEYLSMGLSSDFEVAVEEGSNNVRIGTAVFGERSNYV